MPTKALLIVHGIGEQHLGETTEKLIRGLTACYGEALAVARGESGQAVSVELAGRIVRLYEVYWADLFSTKAGTPKFDWSIWNRLAWHPSWCRKFGTLPRGEYPGWLVVGQTALLVPLIPAAYLAYLGARFFAQMADKKHRDEAHAIQQNPDAGFIDRSRALAEHSAHGETVIEGILNDVVADIPNYMNSMVAGAGHAYVSVDRFRAAVEQARKDGCEQIAVLAHSLGTVVAYHALSSADHAPERLYTIGCPLEKIRFFWPWTIRTSSPSTHGSFRWTNFYHRSDLVSGRLKRYEKWAPVENVRLRGGGGLLRSHVVYESSPQFLETITADLFGAPASPRLTSWMRWKDRLLTLGENLLGPVAIVVAAVVGAAFVAVLVLVPAWLIGFPVAWFSNDQVAGRVKDTAALIFLGMFAVVLLSQILRFRSEARGECLVKRP